MKKTYGLIGNPLGHSFSPQIHAGLGDYEYKLFPLEENEVADFLTKKEFSAINVTIPYKQTVMKYCDRISDEAQKIGSVNTIVKEKDGSLSGYNTDYFGFRGMLERATIDPANKKCLVLGSGGSSKTVCCVLKDLGAKSVTVISRSGENNYQNLYLHKDAQIIVNTTPVGMYPRNGETPVDLDAFPSCIGVADLIYNPEKTELMLNAERKGIAHCGGLYMLVAQGARASEYFLNVKYQSSLIEKVYEQVNSQMRNIILIGMPGCGKTTVAKELARLLDRPMADCDDYITETYGKTPQKIITAQGVDRFREIENLALSELTKRTGIIIATGGGAVTVQKNHSLIRQNGKVFFIDRRPEMLQTENRPLSQGGAEHLMRLYNERLPYYKELSDFTVISDESTDALAIARRIADIFSGKIST